MRLTHEFPASGCHQFVGSLQRKVPTFPMPARFPLPLPPAQPLERRWTPATTCANIVCPARLHSPFTHASQPVTRQVRSIQKPLIRPHFSRVRSPAEPRSTWPRKTARRSASSPSWRPAHAVTARCALHSTVETCAHLKCFNHPLARVHGSSIPKTQSRARKRVRAASHRRHRRTRWAWRRSTWLRWTRMPTAWPRCWRKGLRRTSAAGCARGATLARSHRLGRRRSLLRCAAARSS